MLAPRTRFPCPVPPGTLYPPAPFAARLLRGRSLHLTNKSHELGQQARFAGAGGGQRMHFMERRTDRRIVVTGFGVVSPVGIGIDKFWNALMEGRSGVRRITSFDPTGLNTQIAAEVPDFDPTDFMARKEARRNDRFVQFAYAAARMALDDSGLVITPQNAALVGVLIGSGIGGAITWEEQTRILLTRGPDRVSPFFIPMIIMNMASGVVSIITGAKGPNSSVVTACATGGQAIGDGLVMGEGAGIVILEALEHAERRGARIYGELVGYGMSGDAYHITQPDPEADGAARSMRNALVDAQMAPQE